jgi:5-methylcytosine-specific restriction enzyme A
MARILMVAFKEVTDAEFLAINIKAKGSAASGGGQSYIDFHASEIPEASWEIFFHEASTKRESPSGWIFEVRSLGTDKPSQKEIELSYRDSPKLTRFGLRSQKLPAISSKGNRLFAWSPSITAFPELPQAVTDTVNLPPDVTADLRIFLIRDDEHTIWAGWRKGPPPTDMPLILTPMFERSQGVIDVSGELELDCLTPQWPFSIASTSEGPDWDDGDSLETPEQDITYSVQKVRKRNRAAVSSVRKLYIECQISGEDFLFNTVSGKPYLEVHHLIPLGKGGADLPNNMIVVSPHVHKMLHYANVSAIEFTKMVDNKLAITINGQPRTISWHPHHALTVLKAASEE